MSEESPFKEIHIGVRDVARAVGDLVIDRVFSPLGDLIAPEVHQRGAEAMLDEHLDAPSYTTEQLDFGWDSLGDWHRVPDIEGKDL